MNKKKTGKKSKLTFKQALRISSSLEKKGLKIGPEERKKILKSLKTSK